MSGIRGSWRIVYRSGDLDGYYWTPHRNVAFEYGRGEPPLERFVNVAGLSYSVRGDSMQMFLTILRRYTPNVTGADIKDQVSHIGRYRELGDGFVALVKKIVEGGTPVPLQLWMGPRCDPRGLGESYKSTTAELIAQLIAQPHSLREWAHGAKLVAVRRAITALRLSVTELRSTARGTLLTPDRTSVRRIKVFGQVPRCDVLWMVAARCGLGTTLTVRDWGEVSAGGRYRQPRTYRGADGRRRMVELRAGRSERWYPEGCLVWWDEVANQQWW